MPIIQINIMTGRTSEQKAKAAEKITDAVVDALEVDPNSVRIMIHELGVDDFYVAGVTKPGAAASSPATETLES